MSKINELKIIQGNLFSHQGSVFAHGVNCAGAMGAGIAVVFKRKWPFLYEVYHRECKEGNIILGMAFRWLCPTEPWIDSQGLVNEKPVTTVYNLAIKSHWRNPASYNAIEASVNEMLDDMQKRGRKEVAMPWIGCGLGGLDQKHVTKILKRCLSKAAPGTDIWIYEK